MFKTSDCECFWGQGPHLTHVCHLKPCNIWCWTGMDPWVRWGVRHNHHLPTLIQRSLVQAGEATWYGEHPLASFWLRRRGFKAWFCQELAVQLCASCLTSPILSLLCKWRGGQPACHVLNEDMFMKAPCKWKMYLQHCNMFEPHLLRAELSKTVKSSGLSLPFSIHLIHTYSGLTAICW